MIHDINFLSDRFYRKQLRNQAKVWRGVALLAFLAVLATATVRQRLLHRRLDANREQMQGHAGRMMSQLPAADSLKRDVRRLEARANLIAGLRLRVRPTRILSDAVDALPRFVRLSEFHIVREKSTDADRHRKRAEKGAKRKQETWEFPEEEDLEQLALHNRDTELIASLEGFAPDDAAIAEYLASLERTNTFATVQLLYTDRAEFRGEPERKFGIRLRISRPDVNRLRDLDSEIEPVPSSGTDVAGRFVRHSADGATGVATVRTIPDASPSVPKSAGRGTNRNHNRKTIRKPKPSQRTL
jgi:Tfp pilus assembly protein PilN